MPSRYLRLAGTRAPARVASWDTIQGVETTAPLAIPLNDALAIIALPKTIVGDMVWQQESIDSELFTASFYLFDRSGATIPALSVELMYRRGAIKGECKATFTVFKFMPPKLRAYQLEVIPDEKIGHREKDGTPFKGPHRHIGDKVAQVPSMGYRCDDHEKWFAFFLEDAQIVHDGKWQPPHPPDAQYELEGI